MTSYHQASYSLCAVGHHTYSPQESRHTTSPRQGQTQPHNYAPKMGCLVGADLSFIAMIQGRLTTYQLN